MTQKPGTAPTRVCVFSPADTDCEKLVRNTELAGYNVEQTFTESKGLLEFISRSNTDHIVLINLGRRIEERLELICNLGSSGRSSIVAIANEPEAKTCARAMESGAQAIVVNPSGPGDILAVVTTAVYQRSRQIRLEQESRELREKLAERKLIEKAKGILMESAKVTESEAFRLIRKQSQDKRRPMAEIATLIISAAELVQSARAGAE